MLQTIFSCLTKYIIVTTEILTLHGLYLIVHNNDNFVIIDVIECLIYFVNFPINVSCWCKMGSNIHYFLFFYILKKNKNVTCYFKTDGN